MKLKALLSSIEPLQVVGETEVEVSGVQADSRRIRKGDLFVALRGENSDGHDHVGQAVEAGAVAVVCERISEMFSSVGQIRVADTRHALARLASTFHGHPSSQLRTIGITGTNGKTTTSYLIASIFQASKLPAGIVGTISYRIGNREIPAPNTTPVADQLQELLGKMIQSGMKAVVMEVSSHALAQHRVDCIAWDAGVFTNFTQDHLDYHTTMEAYLEAKKILFHQLGRLGKKSVAVLNHDDVKCADFRKALAPGLPVVSYGLKEGADVRATEVEHSVDGCRFTLQAGGRTLRIATPLCGRHNVLNCLAAAATGFALGMDLSVIQKGIEAVPCVPGRLERVRYEGVETFAVFVDYAHTDDALRNVLGTLKPLTHGRLITVFGCGGNRDKTKRPLMGKVSAEFSDETILTTDNPRFEEPEAIVRDIAAGFGARGGCQVILDRREAIRSALGKARAGDVVLLAGKGHEAYQEVKGTRFPFDDRQVALQELAAIFETRSKEDVSWKS